MATECLIKNKTKQTKRVIVTSVLPNNEVSWDGSLSFS